MIFELVIFTTFIYIFFTNLDTLILVFIYKAYNVRPVMFSPYTLTQCRALPLHVVLIIAVSYFCSPSTHIAFRVEHASQDNNLCIDYTWVVCSTHRAAFPCVGATELQYE